MGHMKGWACLRVWAGVTANRSCSAVCGDDGTAECMTAAYLCAASIPSHPIPSHAMPCPVGSNNWQPRHLEAAALSPGMVHSMHQQGKRLGQLFLYLPPLTLHAV